MPSKKTKDIPAPPDSPDYVPDIQELGLDKPLLIKLSHLIEQHGALGAEKSRIEKERKALTPLIKTILGEEGIARLNCGEYRAAYYNVPRTSLVKEQLILELMERLTRYKVPLQVINDAIAAATVTKDCYTLKVGLQAGWKDYTKEED